MKNQQLGNMVTKVEIVHIIHNALVLCVIDLGGGGLLLHRIGSA